MSFSLITLKVLEHFSCSCGLKYNISQPHNVMIIICFHEILSVVNYKAIFVHVMESIINNLPLITKCL